MKQGEQLESRGRLAHQIDGPDQCDNTVVKVTACLHRDSCRFCDKKCSLWKIFKTSWQL